jgi:xanthine dehydrogenase accessory factor
MNEEVFKAVTETLSLGNSAALVTIIRTEGSTPQRVGAKMLVFSDGRTVGTIGGGCYENDAFWKARKSLETRRSQVVRYELADDIAEESGLICGGQMEVYIEPLDAAAHLYLIGAGHVSYHLAQAASQVNFKIHVLDDREKFANQERFPNATEITVDDIPSWLTSATFPNNAYVVILTRGHTHDLEALRALVPHDLRYLGLIGSRAKVARLYSALQEESVSLDTLTQVHAPVGLDIGAVSPQEIAISILAELIAVKYGKVADVAPLRWSPDIDQTATVSANEQ